MVQKYKRTITKSFPKCGTNKKANENTPICKQNKNPVSDWIIRLPKLQQLNQIQNKCGGRNNEHLDIKLSHLVIF